MRIRKLILWFSAVLVLTIGLMASAQDNVVLPPPRQRIQRQPTPAPPPPQKTPEPSAVGKRGTTTITPKPDAKPTALPKVSTKTSGYLSTFTQKPNLDNVVLYISPLDIKTRVGEEFVTEIVVSNRTSRAFDHLFIVLSYPPDNMEPLGFSDDWTEEQTLIPGKASVFHKQGVILYEVTLRQPVSPAEKSLVRIKWRAIKPVEFSELEFLALGNKFTSLALGTQDILGDPGVDFDGVIPASIKIEAPPGEEPSIAPTGKAFDGYIVGDFTQLPEFDHGLTLRLIAESEVVKTNTEFLVDIYLENKNKIPADTVDIFIQYDPKILQVIDYDDGNWITTGINIFDGAYHDDFPFDYQIKNLVYPLQGLIHYKMATSTPAILANSGTIATIKFKPLQANVTTLVKFKMPDSKSSQGTCITFMKQDVLGSPEKLTDGVVNCQITIKD